MKKKEEEKNIPNQIIAFEMEITSGCEAKVNAQTN